LHEDCNTFIAIHINNIGVSSLSMADASKHVEAN